MASVVVVLVRSWKETVMASPGDALPQMWIGMSRWRTMWLEKSFGRETSAWMWEGCGEEAEEKAKLH